MPSTPRSPNRLRGSVSALSLLALAVVAYVPLLLTKRGLLADDTKIYLYLDPRHLVSAAASLWTHDVAFGTVTHQNIGYLFPMGPYFWFMHAIGVPMWIAQRLWMGSLLLLAALGIIACARELGLSKRAAYVAAWPYMLSPYILVNLDRTSALLMPWAGLGWMMLFVIRAARKDDWRSPALFALVVALVGGINATSIVMIAVAPLAYLIYVAHAKEISWRRCAFVMVRIGSLSLLVSLWWLSGLWAESHYGINVLKFTESFATVSTTSSSSEVLRGLGYWYFYGWDSIQPWTLTELSYTSGKVVPLMSFVLPLSALAVTLLIRWRYRTLAAATVFFGVIIAVGSYPLEHPTPFGWVFKWFADHTTIALAMRSSNRVVPVILLWLALLLGAGIDALAPKWRQISRALAAGVILVSMFAMLPLFQGRAIASNLTFPETLPRYVKNVAAMLNKGEITSAVMGLPGQDFAYYRYGTANDSIWPAILKRPWISNQVAPEGEPASANLIRALDSTLQDNIANPDSIAPVARLFSAGDVLVQMDQQYERFGTPLPAYMWSILQPTPSGLKLVGTYGPRTGFKAVNGPFINEQLLGFPLTAKLPRSLAVYSVSGARALVRTENAYSPQIVAGDGEGLVTMGALGLLDNQRAIYFDAALSRDAVNSLAGQPGAWLVLTDSNQKRYDQYGTLSSNAGYVLTANEQPLVLAHNQIASDVFPNEPPDAQTVALMKGLAAVGASGYGNIITNNPEVQPYKAVDGSLDTAWQVAAFSPAIGQFFQMTANQSQTISKLHLTQTLSITNNRWITKVGITIDNKVTFQRFLAPVSRTSAGQDVTIPATNGRTIRITIEAVTGNDKNLPQASSVGFAEVSVPGFGPVTRGLLAPTSLLSAAGPGAATDRLTVAFNRMRAATHPVRLDPEIYLLRYFKIPYPRSFTLSGLANINPAISDDQLDYMLGRHAGPGISVIGAESSTNLTGSSLYMRAWGAFDNDPSTGWAARFHAGPGEWVREDLNAPVTVHQLTITIVNDGYHMVPTAMTISNGTTTIPFTLPVHIAPQHYKLNTTQTVTINIPALTGSRFTYTITKQQVVPIIDRISGGVNFASANFVQISIPGVSAGVTPSTFDSGCRTNLMTIDGHPVAVRVSAPTATALAESQMTVTPCNTTPFVLQNGMHSVQSAPGYLTGLNINNVVLDSAGTNSGPSATSEALSASWSGQSTVHATVPASMAGRIIVLGQSENAGWHAVLAGKDLGAPTLIDGVAMGWQLPSSLSGATPITFTWQPQRVIDIAVYVSGLGLFAVCLMALTNRPRRRTPESVEVDDTPHFAGLSATLHEQPIYLYGTAIVAGLAVSLFLVPVLVLCAWAWHTRRWIGRAMAVVSIVLLGGAALASVIATQLGYEHDISWPGRVVGANSLAWVGLALWVLVIVGTGTLAGRPGPRRSDDDSTDVDVPDSPAPTGTDAVTTPRRAEPGASDHSTDLEAPHIDPGAMTTDVDVVGAIAAAEAVAIERARHARVETQAAPAVAPIGSEPRRHVERRRGLNVPHVPDPEEDVEDEERLPTLVPPVGLHRTRYLVRAGWTLRDDPDAWHAIVAQDIVNQMVGKTPLYNRQVLDITDSTIGHAPELLVRGAKVTSVRRAGQEQPTPDALEFTQDRIPLPDESFDLVFATNILSSVKNHTALLDELVRVTRRGGTIYLQNRMWFSPWGGHETSPWHLLGGARARRRYTERQGHEPKHRYGENLFALRPGALMRELRHRDDLVIYIAGPRVLPTSWTWTLKVPLVRDLLVGDVIVVAERSR